MKKLLFILIGIIVILIVIVLIKTFTYPFKKIIQKRRKAGKWLKMTPLSKDFQAG